MKRLFYILSFLFFTALSYSQSIVNRSSAVVTVQDARLKGGLNFYVPVANDTTLNGGLDSLGGLLYVKSLSGLYLRDTTSGGHKWTRVLKVGDVSPLMWGQITGTLSNQTDLQNALDAKLNISDTTFMLSPYLRKIDTASLSNRIDSKLSINDTTAMLAPYLREADTTTLLAPYFRQNGNTFGATATLGTADDNHLDIITNGSFRSRFFNSGGFGLNTTTNAGFLLDVNGLSRFQNTTTFSNGGLIVSNSTGAGNDIFFTNPRNISNFSIGSFYPSTPNANSNTSISVIPKGTGVPGNLAQISVLGSDFIANSSNYELAGVRATGSSFLLATGSNGSGLNRPLILSAGLLRDGVTNDNQIRLHTSGNVSINSSADGGFMFDVNGTSRFGNNITFTNPSFTLSNGGGISIIANNTLRISGGSSSESLTFGPTNTISSNVPINVSQINTLGTVFTSNIGSSAGSSLIIRDLSNLVGSSVTQNAVSINHNIAQQNTNPVLNLLNLAPTYNQNISVINGLIRGYYYNPTLTNIANTIHRAMQLETGDALFGTTSGSVGIGVNASINASAILDITSSTRGFLRPRQTTVERNAISSPARGLSVYDSTINTEVYYNGTAWVRNLATNDVTPSAGQIPLGNGSNYAVTSFASTTSVSTTSGVSPTSPISTYRVDASGGSVTLTITPAFVGQIINIKRIDNSVNTITVQMASGNIDGGSTYLLFTQYENIQLQWNGTSTDIL